MIAACPTSLAYFRRPARRRAFTLVEVMMATAVGALVLAAIASIFVMSARIAYKNREIDASATNTRLVQEHLNNEMSIAVSQTTPVDIRPRYSLPSDTTPVRYGRITYRVPVGSFSTLVSTTDMSLDHIVIDCPADVLPKENDYVLMDNPSLGDGIRITGVSFSGSQATINLASSIADGTVGDQSNPKAGILVRIQRQRAYETAEPDPADSPVTELHWYETWYEPTAADTPYLVLSRNVDASARYLFAQVPEEPATPDPSIEPAVSWQFSYVSEGNGAVLPGARSVYYQTNYAEGLIMPKSGNPLNTTSILGGGSSTSSTTTTSSTTSSSTTSYTTTSTTTSISTSSTTTSYTTTSTSTTTSYTTTTSTTSISTSSTTTSYTTTSSTTSVSTSSTSTSYTTTTSTTSISTSSISTSASTSSSTTSVSTSSSTTSATTTSTSTSTTSVSTSSTTSSATTSSTSTSVSTTTTTTSIPFDG